MSLVAIDRKKYAELLAETLPVAIQSETENERYQTEIGKLIDKGERRSIEESALLQPLVTLVEDYERKSCPIERASPRELLTHLMEENALRQVDLVPIFGSRPAISSVLSGRRTISKLQAKKLAARFRVRADLFI